MGNINYDKNREEKAFWRSIEEYNKEHKIDKKREFLEGVDDDFSPDQLSGMSRRKFMALIGASAAFSASACSDYLDQGEIVPYTKRPDEVLPGTPNYYASSSSSEGGLLIKTRIGRPVKVDGNPEHPISKGKISAISQAHILELYDPSRLKYPTLKGRKSSWKKIETYLIEGLVSKTAIDKEIAVIVPKISSPSTKNALAKLQSKFSKVKTYSYELFNELNRTNAWKKCYPETALPAIDFEKANVIVALDSDFLGKEGNYVENTRKFATRRDIIKSEDFNRLYVCEANMSLTGTNADYRLRVKPNQQFDLVMSLLSEVISSGNSDIKFESSILNTVENYNLKSFGSKYQIDSVKLNYIFNDLINNKGASVVYAGNKLLEEVHIAVNLLNAALGNVKVYDHHHSFNEVYPLSDFAELKELVASMNSGNVGAVIHLDTNPVFTFPGDLRYAEALKNVDIKVALTETQHDTSVLCDAVLPIHHDFEAWGDNYSRNGVYNLQQPVIAPLYDTRQKEGILLSLTGEEYSEDLYHKFVQDTFKEEIYDNSNSAIDFKSYWFNTLHDGFVKINTKEVDLSIATIEISKPALSESKLIILEQSYFIGDGKYANNGWLQEIPHPVSKVAWDNYAAIAPATASKLDVVMNDMIRVSANGQQVDLPVLVQPGVAEDVIAVELGYGRSVIADAGKNVGTNANILFNSSAGYYTGCTFEKISGKYDLVSSQEHHAVDDDFVKDFHLKRNIIREGSLDEFQKNPKFATENDHKIFSITKEIEYNGIKWTMAIDSNKCTSCAVCVASCNVENNIPVVGKDQVGVGREMHWMRLDRYYSGSPEDPIVSHQPMLCQHCDNAPCENVCPVNATNHSPDGLNQMVYNRCVGTRYCANNCPYKVRRYNFFNFRDHFADAYYENEVTPLVHNPEVTVRARGVMEKCTFCVQNISQERTDATREGREIDPSRVKTACQTACPADAIVFGDANDPESEVSKYLNHDLNYQVLGETNVKPAVNYFAKLRNTHSEEA